jgi:hypothetical protein
MSQARKEGVCVTHGAQTRRCDHEGCSKQVVRGGKCNSHGQSERPQMVSGRCSKCPIFSNTMQKVDGDLVCVCVTPARVTVEREFGVLSEGVINMSDP